MPTRLRTGFTLRRQSRFNSETVSVVQAIDGQQAPSPSIVEAVRLHALIDQLYAEGEREQPVTFDYRVPE